MNSGKHKILWIDVLSELGGAQFSMLEVCKKLAESGLAIEAALPSGPLSDRLKDAGITVYPISPIRASKKGFALFTSAAKLLSSPHTVNQIVRGCKPDLIHTNSLAAFMTTTHVPDSTPVLWHVRDILRDPHLIHNSIRRATGIISASEAIDECLTDIIPQRHLDKLHLVRNGIDASKFTEAKPSDLRTELGLPQNCPIVGMAAHMIPWKNHDVFIESAALIHEKMSEVQFALFGRDLFNENKRYIKQLKALIAERGLHECFHWIDNNSAPETFLPALDLLIHPARHEPFGRIICEAMVSGVPVIAADSSGPATIITDQINGRLAVDGMAEHFAEIAIELLNNPTACKTIAANAREHILGNFTTERVCRDLIKLYDEIIRQAREDRNYSPDDD